MWGQYSDNMMCLSTLDFITNLFTLSIQILIMSQFLYNGKIFNDHSKSSGFVDSLISLLLPNFLWHKWLRSSHISFGSLVISLFIFLRSASKIERQLFADIEKSEEIDDKSCVSTSD